MPARWRQRETENDVASNALKLLDVVALLRDVPRYKLRRGQVGTIVEAYKSGRFEVEFSDNDGQTYALATLPAGSLLRLSYDRGPRRGRRMVA
jgi:hypothetical protein